MSKHLRMSEKWFNRGLWLISFVFAWFLIGLGGSVVNDLPRVERHLEQNQFINQNQMKVLEGQLESLRDFEAEVKSNLKELQTTLTDKQKIYSNARDSYSNWITTRNSTKRADQDKELIDRTKNLDFIKKDINKIEQELSNKNKELRAIEARKTPVYEKINILNAEAYQKVLDETKKQNLRVFLYRLAIALPLLLVSGWLFVKKRKKQYWPFVWGFIFFAFFTFFVELVPYLPSYGGYVRYSVGIVITLLAGHYAIRALNKYLIRQKLAEAQPETQRRKELVYDVALARLSKGICPGCERSIDLNDPERDFCPHCGINLYNHCPVCKIRKNTFMNFCHSCGYHATGDEINKI